MTYNVFGVTLSLTQSTIVQLPRGVLRTKNGTDFRTSWRVTRNTRLQTAVGDETSWDGGKRQYRAILISSRRLK